MGSIARHDRAKMTMIERQKPKDSKTFRGRDNRGVRKPDLQITVLVEKLGAAGYICLLQRHDGEFVLSKCMHEVARRVGSETCMKQ